MLHAVLRYLESALKIARWSRLRCHGYMLGVKHCVRWCPSL